MSLVTLTDAMLERHEDHKSKSDACPLCARFGVAKPDDDRVYKGRLFAINPPYSTEPANW